MEDPRAELKLLVQATRALMEYTREATPEGAFIDETQVFSPKEVKPTAALIEEPFDKLGASPFGKVQGEPVKTLQAPPETPREIPVPKVEPHPQRVESQIPAGQIGFKELFASLGGMGEPAPTPQKRAAAVATKLPDPPKPEPAKGPLSKARVIEVLFEDRMKNQNALEEISAKASKCENCKLCKTRNSVVWGVGPAFAPLMFIGEGPGENEDRQGIPFVGAAGQLLNKIVVATGFSREDMYIANVVKCLRYLTPVQLEDGSWKRIGNIVRERYQGRVMSVDENGQLVPKQITGWHASPLGDRRVYKLSYNASKINGSTQGVTWLTHDHEVMTERGWVAAASLSSEDRVAVGQGLSRVAYEVAVGSLLGDAHLGRNATHLQIIHSKKQEEYCRLKGRALAELSPSITDGKRHETIRMFTKATRSLRVLRQKFYPEGTKKIPEGFVLTPRMLAVWFLDDGYTKIKSETNALSEIAAHSFDERGIEILQEGLRALGVETYTRASSVGRIHFGAEASKQLSRMIAPYCPPSMRYKLHPIAKEISFLPELFEPGTPETLYDTVQISHVPNHGTDKTFYCIDVEDTHNFVTPGGVVHNCRPPGNRNPEPDEVAACWPFLEKQVELVSPKVIVTLGRFAAQAMLKTTAPISKLRGVVKYYNKIPLVATFHPAYLLRNPADKRLVWEDMQVVRRVYDEIVG